MTVVRFAPRPGRRTEVAFAYDQVVVSVLKSTVPAAARSWDAATKTWAVDPTWTQALADELIEIGCSVRGLPAARRAADNDTWARELFAAAGPELADKLYRALSKVLHPDAGGSTALQQQLNDAKRAL